jgi:hypothetical protein
VSVEVESHVSGSIISSSQDRQGDFKLEFLLGNRFIERGRGKRPWGHHWGTLARAGLDLLDAWSDGNATAHDRLSPLGEALAVTLADTRPFL